jgi:hypothetical protein
MSTVIHDKEIDYPYSEWFGVLYSDFRDLNITWQSDGYCGNIHYVNMEVKE